jgi:hypothetical protein
MFFLVKTVFEVQTCDGLTSIDGTKGLLYGCPMTLIQTPMLARTEDSGEHNQQTFPLPSRELLERGSKTSMNRKSLLYWLSFVPILRQGTRIREDLTQQ